MKIFFGAFPDASFFVQNLNVRSLFERTGRSFSERHHPLAGCFPSVGYPYHAVLPLPASRACPFAFGQRRLEQPAAVSRNDGNHVEDDFIHKPHPYHAVDDACRLFGCFYQIVQGIAGVFHPVGEECQRRVFCQDAGGSLFQRTYPVLVGTKPSPGQTGCFCRTAVHCQDGK